MRFSKKKAKEFFLHLYNFFHSVENEERIRFAAYRLNKMIIAEGIAQNQLNRFHKQTTSPYSPPNSTPEELGIQKFLEYRDRLILQASELEPSPAQDIVHEKCLETNELRLGFKYTRKWLKSVKIDLNISLPGTKSEDYEKKRILSKVPPLGIESSRSTRVGATRVNSAGGGSLDTSKITSGGFDVKRVGFEDEEVISTNTYANFDKTKPRTSKASSELASIVVAAPVVQYTADVKVLETVTPFAENIEEDEERKVVSKAVTAPVAQKTVSVTVVERMPPENEPATDEENITSATGECSHRRAAENVCPAATPADCSCPKPTLCLCPKIKPKSFRRWFL